ncbi:MAG: hypothetical protein ACIALR_13640 [Blastopirellula sp. JB062]
MSVAPPSAVRRPWSHAIAGAISLFGAVVSGLDWPDFPDNLQHLSAAGVFAWGVAVFFLLIVSAGHFRVAILDWQALQAPLPFERRTANLWILVHVVALAIVGVFYGLGRDSVLLMAGQTEIFAALSTASAVSLLVWSVRRYQSGRT